MNSKGFHWKIQENISHGDFPQLEYRGIWQEPKELNHIFSPGECSTLDYGGLLNTWTSISRSPPKHIEDNGYILNNAMGIELVSKFPLLGSRFDSWMERKDLDF